MSLPRLIRLLLPLATLAVTGPWLHADRHVVVIASANPDYEQARAGPEGHPRTESYVFMEGNHYQGYTVDRSIEFTTFRDIAGYLAPELAKQQYVPGTSAADADLLLLVHWGTTLPKVGVQEMTAKVTQEIDQNRLYTETLKDFGISIPIEGNFDGLPQEMTLDYGDEAVRAEQFQILESITDDFSRHRSEQDNISLLGYGNELHRLSQGAMTTELEKALRHDLVHDRYFIIIKAYQLRNPTPGVPPNRPVWTMHLNIASPGNNFQSAVTRMGAAAALFAGQTTVTAKTIRPRATKGTVTLAPLVILNTEQAKAVLRPATP